MDIEAKIKELTEGMDEVMAGFSFGGMSGANYFRSQLRASLLQMKKDTENELRRKVEGMIQKVPTNDLMDVAMALRDPKTLTPDELKRQEERDLSLTIKHVACAANNEACYKILSSLNEQPEENKN